MNLSSFSNTGILKIRKILPRSSCEKIIKLVNKNRNWGKELFLSKEDYFKRKKINKINPGKNIQNLSNKFNLNFIEKNSEIKKSLTKILGKNYRVILAKFIISVPKPWMPDYVKDICKKDPYKNLNKFIKKKYRDVTYFQGLDFHMDSIDRPFQSNKFVTMYVYLNKVSAEMSPIEIVEGSHKYGHVPWPHFLKNNKKSSIEYSVDNKKFYKLKKSVLSGGVGDVFIWTSNTLHGTSIPKNKDKKFRISLRYLIEKKK